MSTQNLTLCLENTNLILQDFAIWIILILFLNWQLIKFTLFVFIS